MLGRATRNIEMSRGGREGNNAFLNYEQARNLHEQEEGLRKLVEENTEYKELMRRSQMKSQRWFPSLILLLFSVFHEQSGDRASYRGQTWTLRAGLCHGHLGRGPVQYQRVTQIDPKVSRDTLLTSSVTSGLVGNFLRRSWACRL